jgi:multidrug resistance efflux pump
VPAEFPAFRPDLAVSEQHAAGGEVTIVKEPVSRRFFRFGVAEQFIIRQLDGATPLAEIRARTEREFGAQLDEGTLRGFIKMLDKNGLLVGSKVRAPDMARGRIRGNLLYLRCALLDPDRLFSKIEPHVRFFFTRRCLLVSAALIVLALAVTATNGAEIAAGLTGLYALAALPLVITLALIVVSAHEFAHGITCKHFGGEVHEMGFMLVYFQPFFYCNVSDAWLFPEKAKRLWVGFAGLYFEFVVWAIATLVWFVTQAGTPINYLAITVMAISGLKSLFDLNPFIKLDGYYILSDSLGIPNLRRRAFKYVGDSIRRLFGSARTMTGELSPREKRVLFTYGVIATGSSFTLLAIGLSKAGSLLIENHQPAALLVLLAFAVMKVGRRFRRLFMQKSQQVAADTAREQTEAKAAEPAPAEATPAPPRRRWRREWTRRLAWGALLAAIVAYVITGHTELRITGPFTVLPEQNADVRASVEGIIESIRVDENAQVKVGDVIARLSDKDLRAELLKTEAAIREARALLRKQIAGPTPEEIELAKADVAKTDDAAKFADARISRLKPVHDKGMMSDQEYDDAAAVARAATHDHASATDRLSVLMLGTRPEDIDATKAQIDGLETQQSLLQEQLHSLNVLSPATGVVATPSRELHAMRGQHVAKGDLIAKVYEMQTVTGQIAVPEKELSDVHVGQPVVLRSRAYPDESFQGTITAIAAAAEGMSGNASVVSGSTSAAATPPTGNNYSVTTRIDNSSGLLKPGMTGLAKISGGNRRVADVIRRRLARTFKVEFWSWW